MAGPKLLMLDEPSLGLAPRVAAEILETLGELNQQGLGILLVEQKAPLALKLAQRVYVLSLGRIVAELPASEIQSHHDLARYLPPLGPRGCAWLADRAARSACALSSPMRSSPSGYVVTVDRLRGDLRACSAPA